MVVEDDKDLARQMMMALAETYEVVYAADGLAALDRISSYQPDILLLDVMLPRMNGYQLCKSIRGNPAFVHTPVVFVTARLPPASGAMPCDPVPTPYWPNPSRSTNSSRPWPKWKPVGLPDPPQENDPRRNQNPGKQAQERSAAQGSQVQPARTPGLTAPARESRA